MEDSDNKEKIWGGSRIRINPFDLNALKLKYVLEDLKDVEGKVLDVGCGAGGMTKAIKYYRPDLKLVGVDISKKAVNEAKKDAQGVEFHASRRGDADPARGGMNAQVDVLDILERHIHRNAADIDLVCH